MPRQLVLFVGLHKTASTSIQKTCAANKRAVLDAGFLYPEFSSRGIRTDNHSGPLRFMFRKEPHKGGYSSKYTLSNQTKAAIELGDELREATSSRLLTLPTSILMVAEGASLLTAVELGEMKKWFGDRNWQIRVICYVRWLSSWISSMVSQRVTGHQRITINSAIDEFRETSGVIRPRIANIREVFPDAEFYSYEAALKHRFGPVGFFFEAIGVGDLDKVSFVRANEGRSDCATRLISSINETLGRTYVNGDINQRVAENDISGLQTIPGARFSLREYEVSPLLRLLAAENEWLKETLGEEFYDGDLVFDSEPCIWTKESLARLKELSGASAPSVRSLISSYLQSVELGRSTARSPSHIHGRKVSKSAGKAIAGPGQTSLPTGDDADGITRGKALRRAGRLNEALASFDRAIALTPNDAIAHFHRGSVLCSLGRLDESLTSLGRAIALRPNYVSAYANRGLAFLYLSRFDEALAQYEQAIDLDPHNVLVRVNRARLLQHLRRFPEALEEYERAIALRPDSAEARWGKAELKLLLGDYQEGWLLNEWRWKTRSYRRFLRSFRQPLWLGEESIAGRTLLIHAEAGLGDAIQFSRYVHMAHARNAKVLLEVQAPLASLMSTMQGIPSVVEKGKPLPSFDLHCPMMSLPLAFRTTLATIPAVAPYLFADPDKREVWRHRLGRKTRPRVGLAWSGRINREIDRDPTRRRYFEFRLLKPLLQLPMEFHSLQKEFRKEDLVVLANVSQVQTHHDELNDFADTAALIGEMDLVISVDTAVAHLAGALAKPVWILLPHTTDYRWMTDRDDSPWYPSATLFRQSTIGDWSEVISRVIERLKIYFDLQPAANFGAIGVESTHDAI